MIVKKHWQNLNSFITKDSSLIYEYFHPKQDAKMSGASLAMAVVKRGEQTQPHSHLTSTEIYFITGGCGEMSIEGETTVVETGHAILIPAGENHFIRNTAETDLVFLCVCSPEYCHEDTVLAEHKDCT